MEEKELVIFTGQVWRKQGPYNWVKILRILDPRYEGYDGGLIGCAVICFPPQLKGIQCRGGCTRFIGGSDWESQVMDNRFLLGNWKQGDRV